MEDLEPDLEESAYRRCADLRLIDSCITQLKAQGPSRTCDESEEEKKKRSVRAVPGRS